jgi:hypothetical protein
MILFEIIALALNEYLKKIMEKRGKHFPSTTILKV